MSNSSRPNGALTKSLLASLVTATLAVGGWWFSTSDDASKNNTGSSSAASGKKTNGSSAKASGHNPTTGEECALGTLPPEAKKQVDDILTGAKPDDGPADGKHFGNYEGLLPKQNSSYYREYTVKTPGLDHRGARRIVVGGGSKQDPDVWYYSPDHFESFCSIPDAED